MLKEFLVLEIEISKREFCCLVTLFMINMDGTLVMALLRQIMKSRIPVLNLARKQI